jgi:hypothetical protein
MIPIMGYVKAMSVKNLRNSGKVRVLIVKERHTCLSSLYSGTSLRL